MDSNKAKKVQFSSGLAGVALLGVHRVQFTFSGTIVGGSRFETRIVSVPYGQKYFSDASYFTTGTINTETRPWKHAPRSTYFTTEPFFPTPRVYLGKNNLADRVDVNAFITNTSGSSFTLMGSYTVNVDVYIFGSNLTY